MDSSTRHLQIYSIERYNGTECFSDPFHLKDDRGVFGVVIFSC